MYVHVSLGVRLSVVFPAHPLFGVLGESRRGHDHRNGNQDESKGVTYWHEVFLFVCRNAKAEERAPANESGRAQLMQDPSATPVTCFGVWATALNRGQLDCPRRGGARYALVERHLLIGGETRWIREAPMVRTRVPGNESTCARVVPCMKRGSVTSRCASTEMRESFIADCLVRAKEGAFEPLASRNTARFFLITLSATIFYESRRLKTNG